MNEKSDLGGRSTGGVLLAFAGLLLLLQNLNLVGVVGPLIWSLFFWGGAVCRSIPARPISALVLATISAGFWAVFILNRRHWWAIIPAGVTGSIAITTFLGGLLPWLPTGDLYLYGLAATFGLVYLLGEPKPMVMWALIPTRILAVIGTVVTLFTSLHLLVPIGLILLGVYQLSFQVKNGKRQRLFPFLRDVGLFLEQRKAAG